MYGFSVILGFGIFISILNLWLLGLNLTCPLKLNLKIHAIVIIIPYSAWLWWVTLKSNLVQKRLTRTCYWQASFLVQRLAWFICVCLFYRDIIFYTPSSVQWKSDVFNTTHNSNTIHDLPILASRAWMPLEDTGSQRVENEGDTFKSRQYGRNNPDNILKCISLNEKVWISIKISLRFGRKGRINNSPALVQIIAWRRPDDKPLSTNDD